MQLSRRDLFIFVEGKRIDAFFYGEVCDSVLGKASFTHQVCRARELAGSSGGKQVLIGFFTYLRRKSALKMCVNGMSKAAIFYVDKDVDDLLRTRKRSDHLVYSEFYQVDNYIFRNGDLVRGSAAAASVDASLLRSCLGDGDLWCKNAANRWREWVKLCLFCKKHQVRGQSNYRVKSRINNAPDGTVDDQEYRRFLEGLSRASGLSVSEFKKAYTSVSQTVDRLYSQGQHDRVFKGAWYAHLLHHDLRRLLGSQAYDSRGFLKPLPSSIAATLDFGKSWADHFRKPLERIVAQL